MNQIEQKEIVFLEALKIVKQYGLELVQYVKSALVTEAVYNEVSDRKADSHGVLYLPRDVFIELYNRIKPMHLFTHQFELDISTGFKERMVWFLTEARLRIVARMDPKDSFLDETLYPFYVAQVDRMQKALYKSGIRRIRISTLEQLDKSFGNVIYDVLTEAWVARIERVKAKGCVLVPLIEVYED